MTEATQNIAARNPFDDWRSIGVAIFMALVGYTVMVSVPVLSTALVDKVGFTEEQVGRVWGADLLGLSLGAVISSFMVARINRRWLVYTGVLLTVVGNALCMLFSDYETILVLRILAGIGSGIFTAVAVVTLGGTTNPVFAFNLELVGFAFSTEATKFISIGKTPGTGDSFRASHESRAPTGHHLHGSWNFYDYYL